MRNISKAGTPDAAEADGLAHDVQTFSQLLLQVGRVQSLRDPIATVLIEMGLTPAQMHTIIWLGADGPLTMGELARRLGITEKTVTGVMDRLEREKLCQRVRDLADRRIVRGQLTARGAAAFKKIQTLIRQKLTTILSLLDASERHTLFDLFSKLIDRIAALSASSEQKEEAR